MLSPADIDEVFDRLADAWQLEVQIVLTENHITADGEVEHKVDYVLTRPGAEPISGTTAFHPEGDDESGMVLSRGPIPAERLTPSALLRTHTAQFIPNFGMQGGVKPRRTAEELGEFASFCWARSGDAPQCWASHLVALAHSADALEWFLEDLDRG